MLGYVLPLKSELRLREYEIYTGYYCGICKYIGRTYGQLPRMALSYDAAFLALLLAGIDEEADEPKQEHCAVHHIRYKTIIRNRAIEYAGDLMLILAWHKLLDDARDEGKLYAKATIAFLKRHYRKLQKKHLCLCESIEKGIEELSRLENERCESIDRVAEPFAHIMRSIFSEGIDHIYSEGFDQIHGGQSTSEKTPTSDMDLTELHRIFAEIGYHMGKWIYLIDAVDDIEENLKSGSYNPLIYRFSYDGESETTDEFRKRIDDQLRFNHLAVIGETVDNLDIRKNSGIIENVIYFGMNRRTEEVLNRIKPPKRRRRTVNEPL